PRHMCRSQNWPLSFPAHGGVCHSPEQPNAYCSQREREKCQPEGEHRDIRGIRLAHVPRYIHGGGLIVGNSIGYTVAFLDATLVGTHSIGHGDGQGFGSIAPILLGSACCIGQTDTARHLISGGSQELSMSGDMQGVMVENEKL